MKICLVSEKFHVSGFAPYPPPALSVVSCEENMLANKNAMFSGFAPYPHLLCECCRLKICLASKKCHVSGLAPYPPPAL